MPQTIEQAQGFTLIEMMITVAIIAIITAIALPLYNNYIGTSQMAAIRATADPLRLSLEDFRIDNSTYKAGGATNLAWTSSGANAGMTALGWRPEGEDVYDYQVTAADNNYTLIVRHRLDNTWLRCENRMSKCCTGTTGSPPATCP